VRKEWRTLREPWSTEGTGRRVVARLGGSLAVGIWGRTGGKPVEHTAQRALFMPARTMLNRMLKRGLPAGKQCDNEEDPR
jgi:hypothetical protein